MRALIITTVPLEQNGITTFLYNEYSRLNRYDDIQITILSAVSTSHDIKSKFEKQGVKIFNISNRKKAPLKYFFELIRFVHSKKYDLVHVHGNSSTMLLDLLASALGGVKHRIVHSHNTTSSHPFMHRLLRPAMRNLSESCTACSAAAGRWLWGKKGYTVVQNGIDLDRYTFDVEKSEKYRRLLGLSHNVIVGNVGAFNTQKNQQFIVDLAEKLVKEAKINIAQFLLIGDGPNWEELREYCRKNSLTNVTFLGQIDNVPDLLNSMDVFILPSLYEGQPFVLVEALSNGMPAVISDKISSESWITPRVANLPLTDQASWIDYLEHFKIPNHDVRKQQSEIAQHQLRSKGFDVNSSVSKLSKVYYNVVGNS